MDANFKEKSSKIMEDLSKLSTEMGDVMKSFQSLHHAAIKDGVLSKKTKELIALAIGVAVRCEGCITFHMQALMKLGVKKEEIIETLGTAVLMGGGPSVMYAAKALDAYNELTRV